VHHLLVIASKRKVMAGDNTTGHVWDEDLRELNNPLPRWWMYLFVLTVVFSAVYLAFYPGLGTNGRHAQVDQRRPIRSRAGKGPPGHGAGVRQVRQHDPEQLGSDAQAMGIGQRLFLNNCAQCHGSDGRGSKGFPNLADADWLGGDTHDYVKGVVAQGRTGMMPPMAAAVGTAEDVKNVANYVLSLSGSAHNDAAAQQGKAKFAVCAACHGPEGKGNMALGAPNLTDKIWLHGWGEKTIIDMVTNGKTNVMPAQGRLLTQEQIHVLGAYVLNLSKTTRVAGN
jgi:cytochrome c oxidase cbb3-type subunit 3